MSPSTYDPASGKYGSDFGHLCETVARDDAYEGIREAAKTGANTADAIASAERVLAARGIRGATVKLSPAEVYGVPRGSNVAIEVSASYAVNSPFFGHVLSDRTTTVRTVMSKE